MKIYLIVALVLVAAFNLSADDALTPTLNLTIESISPDGHIKIGIHNETAKDIRVWIGPYSWAWDNWRVLVLRNGEERLYCSDLNEDFTVNFPATASIKPGATLSETLHIGTRDWEKDTDKNAETRALMLWQGPKDTQPLLQKGDKIIVLYDVRRSKESNQYDVWVGLTSATKDYLPK